ncbi:MAG: carboxylating nicotinate-nucleotide diphosphorylase [Candidatus Krumholzibacteria bacterium]|nr:carboxylating nicotinate-nucleotide diphosphorylase [Candidatus Krumholzibacteria bacterium]
MGDLEELVVKLARMALEEDAALRDQTTGLLVDSCIVGTARIRAVAAGVISGQRSADAVFGLLDEGIVYSPAIKDGEHVTSGGVVATVEGRLAAILSGERTALNFLQHLSGIATLTARFVEKVKGTGVVILDTRKTTPGLRLLEKRAVLHGGGCNHRVNLEEQVLVKENHISAAGGLGVVLEKLGGARFGMAEIEVSSLDELRVLRGSPPGRVMLDNFEPWMLEEALRELEGWGPGVSEVEVSGGVTLETIGEFAKPGVDFISIGSLTSSAPALDLSLIIDETAKS